MSEPLRILFLGDPASANTAAWVDAMRRKGAAVTVASARPSGIDGVVPVGPRWLPPRLRILLAAKDVRRVATSVSADVVIGYRVTSYGYLGASSGVRPLVVAAQNEQITWMRHPNRPMTAFLERCARRAICGADLFHAWGDNIRKGLLARDADDAKILVMHRGIDIDLFHLPDSMETTLSAPVFVSTRSLAREYRVDQLIRAFALVLKNLPSARLVIIGDGDEMPRLQEFASNFGLGRSVDFLGRLSRVRLADELRKCHVYVSLIGTEGVSSSLIEAFASGVVPIVADMSASRELIEHGRNGLLVRDLESPSRIAEAMAACAADSALRSRAAVENRKTAVSRFDAEMNIDVFLDRYRRLADTYSKAFHGI